MPHFANIPTSLQSIPHWLLWRREFYSVKQRWAKVPYDTSGHKASSIDPRCLSPFSSVMCVYDSGGFDGIGFVPLPSDNLTFFDLDDCRIHGVPNTWAVGIIKELNSYTDVTPSDTGYRIICSGQKPDNRRSRTGKNSKNKIEIYDGHTSSGAPGGRFLTLTGNIPVYGNFKRTNHVMSCSQEIAKIYYREFGLEPDLNIIQESNVLKKARSAKNGSKFQALWSGGNADLPSASEADLALMEFLAYWSDGNTHLMENLFKSSPRYRPEKYTREGEQMISLALNLAKKPGNPAQTNMITLGIPVNPSTVFTGIPNCIQNVTTRRLGSSFNEDMTITKHYPRKDQALIRQAAYFCKERQKTKEPGEFFYLSGKHLGGVLGVSQKSASVILKKLTTDGFLMVGRRGHSNGFAREYLYLK